MASVATPLQARLRSLASTRARDSSISCTLRLLKNSIRVNTNNGSDSEDVYRRNIDEGLPADVGKAVAETDFFQRCGRKGIHIQFVSAVNQRKLDVLKRCGPRQEMERLKNESDLLVPDR